MSACSWATWIPARGRSGRYLWEHALRYLMDAATAGEPVPDVVWLAGTGPFFLSSVIADSEFTTAAIFLVKVSRGGGW